MKNYNINHIKRTEEIGVLKELINRREYYKENSQNGISILINGSWGSGKTSFINDFCDDIMADEEYEKYEVYKYDAFEYDFYENPFIPIFSFLHDNLKLKIDVDRLAEITSRRVSKMLVNASYTFMNGWFKSKFGKGLDELKEQIQDFYNEYEEKTNAYNEFKELEKIKNDIKTKIRKYTKDGANPIIFIIDELDRCNPTFAIKTLEILKYFLDIENFIIILSLDEKQLQESVKTIYGQGMNSDIYFSKFFDYKFNLNKLNFTDIIEQSSITNLPNVLPALDYIFDTLNVSVRDSHKIFAEFLYKYLRYNGNESTWTEYQCYFILFMLTLKNIDLSFYNNIINMNFHNYMNVLKQSNDVDKKKYIKLLGYSVYDEGKLENCLNSLMAFANVEYIELKFLNYPTTTMVTRVRRQRDALKDMHSFLPQVSQNKTYMENLLEILN